MELALTAGGAGRHQSAPQHVGGFAATGGADVVRLAQFPALGGRELVAVEAGYGVEPAGTVEERFAAVGEERRFQVEFAFPGALIFAFRLGEQAFELHVACLCPRVMFGNQLWAKPLGVSKRIRPHRVK